MVIPVHNEEAILPRTIGSVYGLGVAEVIWGLDKCTDGTQAIIESWARAHPATRTELVRYTAQDGQGWRERLGFLFRDLYGHASHDLILDSGADLRLDVPRIRKALLGFPFMRSRLVSFSYWDWPLNYQTIMARLITLSGLSHGMSGLLCFSREAMIETEDMEDLRAHSIAEDTHLQMAVARKYPTRHILTDSLHLRASETPGEHFKRGQAQWLVMRKPLSWAVAHSVAMARPAVLPGYLQARASAPPPPQRTPGCPYGVCNYLIDCFCPLDSE